MTTDTELQRKHIGHILIHTHRCVRMRVQNTYNYTPLNAIAYVDFRWNINNGPEVRYRADPKTRIERFRNADHPRRASRGKGKERYHTDDFFFSEIYGELRYFSTRWVNIRAKNGVLDVAIIERNAVSPNAICVTNLPLSLIGASGNGKNS